MTRTAAWGLFRRRERWGLSPWGRILAAAAAVALAGLGLRGLYGFLAVTRPVPSSVLVVDGWLPTYCLAEAASVYSSGHYDTVLAVRGVYPLDSADLDRPVDDYVADILVRRGVPRSRLHSVLFPGLKVDRTYSAALAVREWFRRRGRPLASLDLATSGAHARRSRLLYRQAMGDGVRVGVIALDEPSFDARHWWRSSEGIREVLFEGAAYLYVRLFFHFPHTAAPPLFNSP